jgi:hypothetical protein
VQEAHGLLVTARGRALAMGALIGCLALGSALPHLIDGLGRLNWRAALIVAAPTAFSAAIIADALVRPGPQFLSGSGPDRRRHRLALRLPGPRRRTHERAARPDRPEPPDETERPAISNHRKDMTMTFCWPSGPPAIGAPAELSRTIGPDDIDRFTQISGDRNPLHYDSAAAKASRFGEIVVQGGITSAILNAVVAECLPARGPSS